MSKFHLQANFLSGVVAVLVDDAFCFLQVLLLRFLFPPVDEVPIFGELRSLIVEAVGDLVAHHGSDGPVVQVLWLVFVEEHSLQNSSWEL